MKFDDKSTGRGPMQLAPRDGYEYGEEYGDKSDYEEPSRHGYKYSSSLGSDMSSNSQKSSVSSTNPKSTKTQNSLNNFYGPDEHKNILGPLLNANNRLLNGNGPGPGMQKTTMMASEDYMEWGITTHPQWTW